MPNETDWYDIPYGTILTVNGTDYYAVEPPDEMVGSHLKRMGPAQNRLVPVGSNTSNPQTLIGPGKVDGETDRFAWESDIPDNGEPSFDATIPIGHVTVTNDRDVRGAAHATERTDDGTCPVCGGRVSGDVVYTFPDEQIRPGVCTGDDDTHDDHVTSVQIRPYPESDTATIEQRHRDGSTYDTPNQPENDATPVEVSGVYERRDSDNFRLSQTENLFDGAYAASEVADELNRKLDGDDPFGYVEIHGDGEKIVWVDDKYNWKVLSVWTRIDPEDAPTINES